MYLSLKSASIQEAVSLDEAKLHLRVDGSDEDGLISSLITAARLMIEAHTDRALLNQNWVFYLPADGKAHHLPLRPAQSIVEVKVNDTATTDYVSRKRGEDITIKLNQAAEAQVEFVVGYGAEGSSVPAPLRQALLQLTGFWYENRGNVNLMGSSMPKYVLAMLAPYKTIKL
jgi:uncharacterized phiE125 gp8 family phage protein